MKNIFYFIVFISSFTTLSVNAQHNDLYLVKLKSGITLKCELLRVVPDSFIVVRQYGLDNTIQMSDVVSVDFSESSLKYFSHMYYGKPKVIKRNLPDSNWTIGVSPGFTIGSGGWWGPTSSFTTRLNLLKGFGPRFMAGFGTGIDPYGYTGNVIAPLVLDGRCLLQKNSPNSLFIYSELGFGFNLVSPRTVDDGGPTYAIGMGRMYRTKRQNVFGFSFGYRYQSLKSEIQRFDPFSRTTNTIRATEIYRRFVAKAEWRF
jgi:hypothetical protein